ARTTRSSTASRRAGSTVRSRSRCAFCTTWWFESRAEIFGLHRRFLVPPFLPEPSFDPSIPSHPLGVLVPPVLELFVIRFHLFDRRPPLVGRRDHFFVRVRRWRHVDCLLRLVGRDLPRRERRKDVSARHLVPQRLVPPEELHVLMADIPPDLLPVPGDGDPVVP